MVVHVVTPFLTSLLCRPIKFLACRAIPICYIVVALDCPFSCSLSSRFLLRCILSILRFMYFVFTLLLYFFCSFGRAEPVCRFRCLAFVVMNQAWVAAFCSISLWDGKQKGMWQHEHRLDVRSPALKELKAPVYS